MCAIEALRVGQKSIQTRFGTEVNRFTPVFRRRKILRIGIENTLADCMEALPGSGGESGVRELLCHLIEFYHENIKRD